MGKLKKILPAIVWDIQVVAELIMVFFVVRLDLLPDSYIILLLGGGLLAVTVLTGFLLLKKPKAHTHGFTVQQIIGMIIAVFVVAGGIVASSMAYRARTAIEVITEEPEVEQVLVTHMGVYVRNDSGIDSVMDIPAEEYGFLSIFNEDWNAKAKVYIEDELLGKHAEVEEVEEEVEEPTLFEELFGKKEEPEPEDNRAVEDSQAVESRRAVGVSEEKE